MEEKRKVLNLYATRYGSVRIVAGEIEKYLVGKGYEVTTVDLKRNRVPLDYSQYGGIILGASVAMFMWMGKGKAQIRTIKKLPLSPAVYICCGTAIKEREKAREKFLIPVLSRRGLKSYMGDVIEPVIDFRPSLGIPEKQKKGITGTIKAMAGEKFEPEGLMDFRDPEYFKGFLNRLEKHLG